MRSLSNSDEHQLVLGRDMEYGSKRGTYTVNQPKVANFEPKLKAHLAGLRSILAFEDDLYKASGMLTTKELKIEREGSLCEDSGKRTNEEL